MIIKLFERESVLNESRIFFMVAIAFGGPK